MSNTSVLVLKDAFRSKILNNIKETGVYESTVMPEDVPLYSGWKVIDPLTDQLSCLRVLVPFRELLNGIEGISKSTARKMPDKAVWFTLLVDQNASEYEANIPEWDSRFVPDPQHINLLIDVLMTPLKNGYGRGYYGWGEAGVGKTSTALWLMSLLRMACVHMNCRPSMEVEEFFLSQIAVDGKWTQQAGPIMNAVLHDWPILIDELDLAPSEFWPALNNLIEGRRYAVPSYPGKQLQAKSCFRVIGFGNTGPSGSEIGSFAGRSQIDASVWDRFYKDYYGTLTASALSAIISANFGDKISSDTAKRISAFTVSLNKAAASGEFPELLSPRGLIAMCSMFIRNENSVRSPLLYAVGTVIGGVLDDSSNLETLLNIYSLEICEQAKTVNEIQKEWKARFCAPLKQSSASASEGSANTEDTASADDADPDNSVSADENSTQAA